MLALILRLAAIMIWSGEVSEAIYEYDQIAHNIVAGRGFSFDMYGSEPVSPTAWMAPFYPYLLAAYYKLAGENLTVMAILQALVGAGTCTVVGLVGTLVAGTSVGLTAAFIFATYPEMIFLPLKFVSESWLLLEQMLILLFGVKYVSGRRRIHLVLTAVFCGLAILTQVSALALPVALLFWFWLKIKASRKLLLDSLIFVLVAACVVAPWTARNYVVFGRFIPVRTNFWVNVWRGNFPGATGTPRNFDRVLHDLALDPEYRAVIDPLLVGNEIQREEVYRQLALQDIKGDPVRYLGLSLLRFLYFWTLDPTHPLTDSPLYWGPWFLLLIFAGLGVFSTRGRWRDYSFWYLLFGITTLVYSLTLVLPRYRIPLLPGLILLAAEGVRFVLRIRRDPIGV